MKFTTTILLSIAMLVCQFAARATSLIPEVINLKDGAVIPAEVYIKHDPRAIGRSIVERLALTMEDPTGKEDFHTLNLPPEKIKFDPMTQTSIQLYFEEKHISEIIQNGFLNLHQKPELQRYSTRTEFRNAIEEGLARIKLTKTLSDKPLNPLNILRPKSAILEFLLPEGQRPISLGGVRYGNIVAVFKDSVKDRTSYTPYDSGAIFSSPYTTDDRLRKEVRPLLGRNYFFKPQHPSEYFEAQIWGTLDIEDVKEFWVPENISPAALENLKKAGVDIYQYIEEKVGVEKNGYYKDYHRTKGIQIFHAENNGSRCSSHYNIKK
jgi:hypothetical protein